MTAGAVLFWTVFIVLTFGFALAVQLRVLAAIVLRRALTARDPGLDEAQAGAAVAWAAGGKPLPDEARPWLADAVAHLYQTYARPLSHIRLARKASFALPAAILVLVAARRIAGL